MSKNKPGLFGTLFAVGALGATAGMLALRWSQRHRMQRQHLHGDLSRWEDEGGSLSESANKAEHGATAKSASATAPASMNEHNAARDDTGAAWPFPTSDADSATRH
ncbi:3-mercaptopyruvate sulfurtransferase SseA [Paraburkholderia bannensis]|uniref:3-mercaptopyruvate sulfurtransferase SseA n=1 Tax=Paraburkholderia bannensis TaxID=765414 RepID=A0A7W9WS47_9BURK|nr:MULTISPECIES: hypothetical protein [Paraburkholderia]MBB3258846.1 3-mercaptopyruvate sulfurtransferase SseA [Paraburkholderia sp. WP4_3_2]MBB6103860.1 3-mercaptopyruvate sulfurtransferase SseA [Paraburkholderia bannensis]